MTVELLSTDELADLIEAIALRIEGGDRSMDLYNEIRIAQDELERLEKTRAWSFMLRFGMLVLNNGRTTPHKYDVVQETIDNLEPLDPEREGIQLRTIAEDIRSGV